MAGCYDDVQDLLTSVNGPDKHIRIVYVGHPDAMWPLSGCYVCECRVPLLEGVRIGEARHVYSWGNPHGGNPDENVCHMSPGSMCHVSSGGGVPTTHARLYLTHVPLLLQWVEIHLEPPTSFSAADVPRTASLPLYLSLDNLHKFAIVHKVFGATNSCSTTTATSREVGAC